MKELLRTNDTVLLSWVKALLADENIGTVELDTHMSILEGSASAIPRRLMVEDDDYARARRILKDTAKAAGVTDPTSAHSGASEVTEAGDLDRWAVWPKVLRGQSTRRRLAMLQPPAVAPRRHS